MSSTKIKTRVTYNEHVSVALIIQHAMCMHHIVICGLIAWPDSWVKFPSTGGACMFVRMYTSRMSFQRTAFRVPRTRVTISPLFIFRYFGPVSCGIPRLPWRIVPHALIVHWNRSSNRAG
jgi:hypothetical protein